VRTAAEMLQASKAFAVEESAKTWLLLLTTAALTGATFIGICIAHPWPLRLALALLLALLYVRLFAFYHDVLHGSMLRRSRIARPLLTHLIGTHLLAVPSVWRETHDFHHAHNSKLVGSSVGSYPVASVAMWQAMTPRQRRAYRLARHPLTLLFGYFTVFGYGMNVAPFLRAPAKHWTAIAALMAHVLLIGLVWHFLGFAAVIFAVILPLAIAHSIGAYLFYAQHNFVAAQFKPREEWSYLSAALGTSSMFDMSPVMHWFTGNLGYHHVHHLNHRIPFYRLPQAMNSIEELRVPHRTSWSPRDVAACLRLSLWDAERSRMISLSELPR
jgi:acyl-lipid omega-6 desaturase (Delta-12 desaturase)